MVSFYAGETVGADRMKVRKIYRGFILNDVNAVCETVRNIISYLENSLGIDSDQCFDIKIILNELLQNAIEHGNLLDCNKKVYMDVCIRESDVLNITIKDQGQGFDVRKVLDMKNNQTECDILDLPECGRGLQIVKSLCDDITFNQRGNCIRVTKRLI
ncbi:anti-sigma regulator [Thermoclostridium stercorarium subsp. stercorarium DSM 8532]|nr:anti-sigma regulator [Thermoclostridium stercorarium subsp. stercorarium DSM 8532]